MDAEAVNRRLLDPEWLNDAVALDRFFFELVSPGCTADALRRACEHTLFCSRINKQDEDAWSPLHYAVAAMDVEKVGILLQHGADPALCDRMGRTPEFYIIPHEYYRATEIWGMVADPTYTPVDMDGHCPLTIRIVHGELNPGSSMQLLASIWIRGHRRLRTPYGNNQWLVNASKCSAELFTDLWSACSFTEQQALVSFDDLLSRLLEGESAWTDTLTAIFTTLLKSPVDMCDVLPSVEETMRRLRAPPAILFDTLQRGLARVPKGYAFRTSVCAAEVLQESQTLLPWTVYELRRLGRGMIETLWKERDFVLRDWLLQTVVPMLPDQITLMLIRCGIRQGRVDMARQIVQVTSLYRYWKVAILEDLLFFSHVRHSDDQVLKACGPLLAVSAYAMECFSKSGRYSLLLLGHGPVPLEHVQRLLSNPVTLGENTSTRRLIQRDYANVVQAIQSCRYIHPSVKLLCASMDINSEDPLCQSIVCERRTMHTTVLKVVFGVPGLIEHIVSFIS